MLRRAVLERLADGRTAVFDRLHRIGHDERPERCTADDNVFPRLPNDFDMAAHGREAAQHADHGDDEADYNCHNDAPGRRGDPASRVRRFALRGTGCWPLNHAAERLLRQVCPKRDVSQPQAKPARLALQL